MSEYIGNGPQRIQKSRPEVMARVNNMINRESSWPRMSIRGIWGGISNFVFGKTGGNLNHIPYEAGGDNPKLNTPQDR